MRDANVLLEVSLMFFLGNNEVSKSPLAVLVFGPIEIYQARVFILLGCWGANLPS